MSARARDGARAPATAPTAPYTGPGLCALPAREVVARLRSGDVSPSDLLDAAFARIEATDGAVNAMVTRCEARARAALADLPPGGAASCGLAGLPIAIKDLTNVAGVRTTFGSEALAEFVPEESDPLVEMLERRGAVVVGKTNTPEFGAGANTFNAVFGATRNPWDTRRNAGGSSGGSAAALATGQVWLAQGSDLAGSLRTPAAYCGVVGLRPSPGRCGGGPAATAFSIEGVSGPMARDVEDLALLLDAMAGFDPRAPISLESPATPFRDAAREPHPGPRVAFSEDQGGFAPVEPEIRQVLRRAMDWLADAGGEVREACPELPDLGETYLTLRGVHYGAINAYMPDAVQNRFKATLRENTEFGRSLSGTAIYDAMRRRTVLYHAMRVFLHDHDVLAIPVVGLEPGPVEEEYPPQVAGEPVADYVDWLRFSFLATTTALPALSLPVGFTASGMPVGLQLVGPPRGEATLLSVARAVEEAVAFRGAPIDPIMRTS